MRPLQVWLPLLGSSLVGEVSRDAERAFRAWNGELVVWLLPGLRQAARWREPGNPLPVLGIPAERLDRVDVYQVDKAGRVFGIGCAERFPGSGVQGLLDGWLNLAVQLDHPSAGLKSMLSVPLVRDGAVVMTGGSAVYEETTFTLESGPILPITRIDDDRCTGFGSWPVDKRPVPSISPEEESELHYGRPAVVQRHSHDAVVSAHDPKLQAVPLIVRFPEPFDRLVSAGAGMDVLYAQALMRDVVETSRKDREAAFRQAIARAGIYIREGFSTVALMHFYPALLQPAGEDAVWHVAEDLKLLERTPPSVLGARDLKGAWESPAWRETLGRQVSIRRAWGIVGLTWALLIEDLQSAARFQSCTRCGRLLRGSQLKRNCGRADDPTCYRRRRAEDRRRELSRRASEARSQIPGLDE